MKWTLDWLQQSLQNGLQCFYEYFKKIPFAEVGAPGLSMYMGAVDDSDQLEGVILVSADPCLAAKIINVCKAHFYETSKKKVDHA